MKLANFYDTDASSEWFTKKFSKMEMAVHDLLRQSDYQIVEKEMLQRDFGDVEIPLSLASMSWGGGIPRPAEGRCSTFIAKEMAYFKKDTYKSQSLSNILSTWMQEKLTGTKFLVSLNPAQFLVATSNDIEFVDVFTVSRTWSFDSWIGVFDDTQSILFLFDIEFSVVIISCDPTIVSDEMKSFFNDYNSEFEEIFVRDAKFRSGIDPLRAQEYFDKVYGLASA